MEDQDMMEMTIDKQLPAHLWKRVFNFLPLKHRKKVSLVCSTFHEVICDMERFQGVLMIRNSSVSENLMNFK